MTDDLRTELTETLKQADQLADLADMYANDRDYRRAALSYSRGLGLLIAALDDALHTEEVPA